MFVSKEGWGDGVAGGEELGRQAGLWVHPGQLAGRTLNLDGSMSSSGDASLWTAGAPGPALLLSLLGACQWPTPSLGPQGL